MFRSYGWPQEHHLPLALSIQPALPPTPDQLVSRLNRLLFCGGMSNDLKTITIDMLNALRLKTAERRAKAAVILLTRAPEFVIQK